MGAGSFRHETGRRLVGRMRENPTGFGLSGSEQEVNRRRRAARLGAARPVTSFTAVTAPTAMPQVPGYERHFRDEHLAAAEPRRQGFSQDIDELARLIALHRVPGVLDDVHALESGCGAGEFGGIVVVDEERVGAAHQRRRRGEVRDVLPQACRSPSPFGMSRSATSRCRRRAVWRCGKPRAATTSRSRCGAAATVISSMASKLGNVRSPCTSATVPFCSSVISVCRSGADGVTSTSTSLRTSSGAATANRSAVSPPSDIPTTRSASGASSRTTGSTAVALSFGP